MVYQEGGWDASPVQGLAGSSTKLPLHSECCPSRACCIVKAQTWAEPPVATELAGFISAYCIFLVLRKRPTSLVAEPVVCMAWEASLVMCVFVPKVFRSHQCIPMLMQGLALISVFLGLTSITSHVNAE
jgi:hypothetical protein